MKVSEWSAKKRKLRNIPPKERLKELDKLLKKEKERRVLIGILFEIRLAKYLIYIKKLKPWRRGIAKPPNETELSDVLEMEEPQDDRPLNLEIDLPPPPPKKEEKIIGKVYSSSDSHYEGKDYRSISGESYTTKHHVAGSISDRVGMEEEQRMTSADRVIGELKEDIKYERNVKKDKKKETYGP
jgi:hypothetical protein